MALPPTCKICKKDIRNEGQYFTIYFKDFKINQNPLGYCGPVPKTGWDYFCKKHKSIEKHTHLTKNEAIEKYKEKKSFLSNFMDIFKNN